MPTFRKRARTEEDRFLDDYLAWLSAAGYDLNFHVIDTGKHAKVTSRGFPDVYSSHPERGVLIAELKSTNGYPSEHQWAWLTRIARQQQPPPDDTAQSRVHLWKPADELMALTQMGTPEDAPVPCDCPVCRCLDGKEPFPKRRKRNRSAPAPSTPCPICGRASTLRRIATHGKCSRCRRSDIDTYEADLIAERTIERVY